MRRIISLVLILLMAVNLNTCAASETLPEPDYLELMAQAAAAGDRDAGLEAEARLVRNTGRYISFDQLFLLSKFISAEAGRLLHSEEFLICVGEIILNRMASPEFPSELEAVIYDEGQFPFVNSTEFQELLPCRKAVDAALRLLQGERLMKSSVVFKSDRVLGPVYSSYCDRVQGFTYFCESPNLKLYEAQNYPQPVSAEAFASSADAPNASFSTDSFRDYKDSSIIVVAEAGP